jgi:predicted phosphohydrolase
MRLVALADTHTFHDELAVPDGDVLVHAGDLCRGGELDELEGTLTWLKALPHRHKIVVAGNHDWAFVNEPAAARALLGDIVYLEDAETTLGGLRFWGSPWQPAYNDWAFNLPRGAALREKWALIPNGIDVLITHGPPAGFGDGGGMKQRSGCEDLRARVVQLAPLVHLFGHIHQDGGLWTEGATTYANVTTWECERSPTVIDIDPTTRIVSGVQIPPRGR